MKICLYVKRNGRTSWKKNKSPCMWMLNASPRFFERKRNQRVLKFTIEQRKRGLLINNLFLFKEKGQIRYMNEWREQVRKKGIETKKVLKVTVSMNMYYAQ